LHCGWLGALPVLDDQHPADYSSAVRQT